MRLHLRGKHMSDGFIPPHGGYRDFLPTRGAPLWEKESQEALYVRGLGSRPSESHETYEPYRTIIETRPAGVVANILICLVHQANFLLDRQIRQLEQAFLKEGSLRERMTRARLEARKRR